MSSVWTQGKRPAVYNKERRGYQYLWRINKESCKRSLDWWSCTEFNAYTSSVLHATNEKQKSIHHCVRE